MYLLLEGGHLLRLAQRVHGNGQEDVEERVVAEHRQEDEVQRVDQTGLVPSLTQVQRVDQTGLVPSLTKVQRVDQTGLVPSLGYQQNLCKCINRLK